MKFEYKQIVLNLGLTLGQKKQDEINETLNELGRDGWEMINFEGIGDTHAFAYVFKRPLRSEF